MYKVIIWMNIPSHHQLAFFEALSKEENINLLIRYYKKSIDDRANMGWSFVDRLPVYQDYIDESNVIESLHSIIDWKERIHIVPGFTDSFLRGLLDILVKNEVPWIHWSERAGKPFTKLFNYNYSLIRFLYPIFLLFKGYKKYAVRVNKYALGAFAISDLARKDFLKWGIKAEKIRELNYSLDALKISTKSLPFFNDKMNKKIFMYVGLLTKHKGISVLIDAFALLKDRKDWILVFVGKDISGGKYRKQVVDYNLTKAVFFTGTINSNEINDYLSNSDVFVLPTLFDGWGAVLNEAASLKKPLISTDQCGAAYHLIKSNFNGFRVRAKSVKELKNALQFYIDNPQLIDEHGNNSFDIFKSFTPKYNARVFISNLSNFLN